MGYRSLALALLLVLLISGCGRKKTTRAQLPPAPLAGGVEEGMASWYGHPYHGRPAANGEIYDMETMTAAHRTLAFGTIVRVANLSNQKTVDVRIIDRGPFVEGRVIDLSHAAARAIDMIGPGVARVRLQILSLPPAASDAAFGVQVGAFRVRSNADYLRDQMSRRFGYAQVVLRKGSPDLWRVVVGKNLSMDQANTLARQLEGELGAAFVIRLDGST